MTELEKMLSGALYDCNDEELMKLWNAGKNLMQRYNLTAYDDKIEQGKILTELLGKIGSDCQITAPIYVDYGKFIKLGKNVEINMNCVLLDCNEITIGDNTLIAPSVNIYTVFHPVKSDERFPSESPFAIGKTAPVTIGKNCWIGGNSTILPGVKIGDNTTIGAGSVVTKDIPANVLAFGNPCRVKKYL